MKKAVVIGICIAAAVLLAAAGVFLWAWQSIGLEDTPHGQVEAQAFGQELRPVYSDWNVPLLGGLLYKPLSAYSNASIVVLEDVEGLPLAPAAPEGYENTLLVSRGDEVVYSGGLDGWDDGMIAQPGEYMLEIRSEAAPGQSGAGYGAFTFSAAFAVPEPPEPESEPWPDEPVFTAGRTALAQGDILALEVRYLPPELAPAAETTLGMAVFTPREEGLWTAAVPVGNMAVVGRYPVYVQAGDYSWQVEVEVLDYAFVEQDLVIDVGDPVIGEANSAEAYQEYRDTIPPLFSTYDEEVYWEGVFLRPAEGRISTEFGTIRYTNGDYANPGIHNGMDIANEEGTPVLAPNNGRVVLARRLLNTGNTIVVEHGGGLKSYYFHMSRLDVEEGQMVAKGDTMGAIGTTGYSTGPHLHYEMRIGSQSISPSMLFEEDAGLYSLGLYEAEPTEPAQ